MGGHGYSSLSVCLFVCLFVCYFLSAHLAALALRLHTTSYYFKILMLKLRCRIKAKNLNLVGLATRGLFFEVRFTAEVIPYQEHWKRVNKVES